VFKIADQEFDISHSALEIFDRSVENTICWGLKILADSPGGDHAMSRWEPAIVSDVLLETTPGQISHWYGIAGTTLAWNEPNEDPQALFEVYETTGIYDCQWQFLAEPGNLRVRLVLDGMTDIDTDYMRVPIHVETLLSVAPWPMGSIPRQACLDRYDQLGFEDPVEYRLDDGVSTLVFLNQ
jgi:hypothetical protein